MSSRRPLTALIVLLLLAAALLAQTAAPARVFPGESWERIEKPESVGFSSVRLEALRAWVKSLDTTALMVVVGGRSLFEYGDLTHLSYLASARKSVLAMLYGKYVEGGQIQLNKTLREIGLTDHGDLLPIEKQATIEHLISARSGVYHAASNAGDDTRSAPPRGSQRPGTYYLYNNWDFNAAGAVFEKLTGRNIYDALESDLARPIGMQDFDRSKQQKSGDLKVSMHPAYHMWLSTRDMARLGLLMLREGDWNGRQVVSKEWVRRITSLVTPLHEMNPPYQRSLGTPWRWGYGYMWWVWDAPNSSGPYVGAYTGMGAGGQFITVVPQADLVIAHKVDMQQPLPLAAAKRTRNVTGQQYNAIVAMLYACHCGANCP